MLNSIEKMKITNRLIELERQLVQPLTDLKRVELESEALHLESILYQLDTENKISQA